MFCYNIIDFKLGVLPMKVCGLVVEYNPFHNGHLHHIEAAREKSNADCIIAVMSGPFLQRGEPAVIDKFYRTRAALTAGADVVIELPYAYAVQSSELFAKGAVHSLHQMGVNSICFGSEIGEIEPFIHTVNTLQTTITKYNQIVKMHLNEGDAFPQAANKAYEAIGINHLDIMQPNNILGLSYVKTIMKSNLPIEPLTIQRLNNQYHDETIEHTVASATSIRKELQTVGLTEKALQTLPKGSIQQLQHYKETTGIWHHWEQYFPLLHYKVMTMEKQQLTTIHGVDEGLENRIKRTALHAQSFSDWMQKIKTKRYTQTRLQRVLVHILTHTTKEEIDHFTQNCSVPYLRLLGMSNQGRNYISQHKKHTAIPIITNLKKSLPADLSLDERAMNVFYSVLHADKRIKLRKQEFSGPIIADAFT